MFALMNQIEINSKATLNMFRKPALSYTLAEIPFPFLL